MIPEFTEQQKMRIAFLAGRYATAAEIAGDRLLNCEPAAIRSFLFLADFPPPPLETDKAALRLEIARDLVGPLDMSAEARRIGRSAMAERILEKVLADGLVSAVMRDGLA